MTTYNNSWNNAFPGIAAHSVIIGEGAAAAVGVLLAAGNILIGTTAGDPVPANLTPGAGISITSVTGSITISWTGANLWVDQTTAAVTMVANTGYTSDDGATLVTFTLPTAASIGDFVEIQGKGAGGWTIAQAASQEIFFGIVHTTAGVTGSLSSTTQYDCVKLRALTAGATSTWSVVSAVGNLSYV